MIPINELTPEYIAALHDRYREKVSQLSILQAKSASDDLRLFDLSKQLAAKDTDFNTLLEYAAMVIEEEFGVYGWDKISEAEREEARQAILAKAGINR